MYKRILVPLDGSETAERGLTEAIALAREMRAGIHLLYVVSDLQWIVEPAMLGDPHGLRADLHRFGEELLGKAVKVCEANGVAVDMRVRDTSRAAPGHAIVEEAADAGCQLVVMGTHGRRGVSRMLLGSDAAVVVATCPVPVLLVRRDAARA